MEITPPKRIKFLLLPELLLSCVQTTDFKLAALSPPVVPRVVPCDTKCGSNCELLLSWKLQKTDFTSPPLVDTGVPCDTNCGCSGASAATCRPSQPKQTLVPPAGPLLSCLPVFLSCIFNCISNCTHQLYFLAVFSTVFINLTHFGAFLCSRTPCISQLCSFWRNPESSQFQDTLKCTYFSAPLGALYFTMPN